MNTITTLTLATATDSGSSTMLPFEIALVIFMIIFVGISAWTIFARRGTFDRNARIPIQDDDAPHFNSGHLAD